MLAYVCFSRDSVKKIVEVKDIKDFHPKDVGDFNPGRPVRVLWRGIHDEIETEEARRYAAQVLRMGRTKQELEAAINAKRITVPKLRDVTDVTSSDDDETQFEVSRTVCSDPARGQTRKEQPGQAEHARLEKIVENYRRTACGGSWSDDDVETSGGECTVPDKYHREVVQQRDRYKARCHQQEEELKDLRAKEDERKEELRKAKIEIKALQILNYRLQTKVIKCIEERVKWDESMESPRHAISAPNLEHSSQERRGSSDTRLPAAGGSNQQSVSLSAVTPNPDRRGDQQSPELFNSEPTEEYSPNLRQDVMGHIREQPNESRFVKSLAVAMWGTELLASRSVTGGKSNRFQSAAKPPLTPKKLKYIKDELTSFIVRKGGDEEAAAQAVKKVPKYINEKIQDISRKQRRGREK